MRSHRLRRAAWLLIAAASWLPVVVTLQAGAVTALTPSGASVGVAINITGTGFNATASNNEVTFAPAAGSGVTTVAASVTTVDAAKAIRRLSVKVPAGLQVGPVALRIVNKANGEVTKGPSFDVIDGQLPALRSAARGATAVAVRVVASANSQFTQASSRFSFGSGISVQSSTVESPTTATAVISVAAAAPLGVRTVTVVSATQTLMLIDAFTVTDVVTPPTNKAPVVVAGAPQTITLPASVSLNGTVSDDGLPTGATVTSTWTKFSGPGTVAFANPANPVTTATFSQAGAYVLRLTASDTKLSATSDVTITVNPAPPINKAPVVAAGAPQTITLPAGASLSGTVSDDGLPTGAAVTSAWTKFSGPGTVSFANPAAPVTTATFSQSGVYVLRLTASDTLLTAFSDVTITVNPVPPTNLAPIVSAGPAQTITLPAGASLSGTVSDDGLPTGAAVTSTWTKFSGPGAVSFSNAANLTTTATFDQAGTYLLRLTASDTLLTAFGDVTITVNPVPPTNLAPIVSAGPAQTITLPAGASLSGTVSDDGLPTGAAVTSTWTKFSGPGAVSFSNAANLTTTATFDQAGAYVLRLTASDTLLTAFGDVTITVNPALPTNQAPTVNAGADQNITLPANASLAGTATDDGLPEGVVVSTQWTKVSGPGAVAFVAASSLSTTASFGQAGQYVLRLTATDTLRSSSDDVTIVVAPAVVNQRPTVNAGEDQTITLPAAAHLAGSATDDGLPVNAVVATQWTKISGPGIVAFDNASSPMATATFSQDGPYVLRFSANDSSLTATDDVAITVNAVPPVNQRPLVNAGADQSITLPSSAALAGTATDDGIPSGVPLAMAWSKVSGPGTVVFGSAAAVSTTASFSQTGDYVLRLTATDSLLTATSDVRVKVYPANTAPVARPGGPYSGTSGAAVAFDGSASSDADHDPLTFSWNFGDGATATGPAPTHIYALGDTYTVTLKVDDARNGVHSATTTVTVAQTNRPPTASAGGPYTVDAGASIALAGAGADLDGDTLSFSWNFGDGTQAGAGRTPVHAFAAEGTYTITLTVADGHGGSASATASAIVGAAVDRAPPIVKLTAPKTALPGTQATVTASAVDNVAVSVVTFDVAGAASSQVPVPPYERKVDIPPLATPGSTIAVKATARDAANNAGSDQTVITIVAAPDTTPPTVAIQLPPQTSPGSTVRIAASAFDDTGVKSVAFSTAGIVFATDSADPYSATFVVPADTAVGSALTFIAQATDFANNHGESAGTLAIVAAPDTQPPTVALGAPESIGEGKPLRLVATVADNVHVASVDFLLDGAVVGSVLAPPYELQFAPGRAAGSVLRLRALAKDSSDNQAFSDAFTRVVGASTGSSAVVAGEVYDDTVGLPLAGATIVLAGIDASGKTYTATATSDARGQYFLNAFGGDATLQITRPGWTRVERHVVVPDSLTVQAIDARLTPLAGEEQTIAATGGGTIVRNGATLALGAGAIAVDTPLRLTVVSGQGVEGLLPPGWSPAAVLDVTPHGVTFGLEQPLTAPNQLKLAPGTPLVFAMWDEDASAWRSLAAAQIASDAAAITSGIRATGQYAWLLADTVPSPPAPPNAGDLIAGVNGLDVPNPVAIDITPQPRVVFYKPGVSARVGAVLRSAVSSGTLLRASITESYEFNADTSEQPDPFVEDVIFYQTPGPASTVSAGFIVTPSQTFDPLDLRRGVITVEMRAPVGDNTLPLIGTDGGTVTSASGDSLEVPAGAFNSNVPVDLAGTAAEQAGLTLPPGLTLIRAVTVGFSGATAALPSVLSAPKPANIDGSTPILLVRLVDIQGVTRLQLVGAGRVVGTRVVSDRSIHPSAPVLDGVAGPGRYAFVRATSGLGFATGTVFGPTNTALAGALVSTSGLPVIAVAGANGRYVVAAALGTTEVRAQDVQRRDAASAPAAINSLGAIVQVDLHVATNVLTVTSLTPAEGASSVSLSTVVVVTFSTPIDPATLAGPGGTGLSLVAADGTVVAGTVSLAAGNTRATLRPTALLAPNTAYTATVAGTIKDPSGRPLANAALAHFTSLDTAPPPVPPAGSISASVPDSNGTTTISGTPGTAAPHDTVQIVNLTKQTFFPAFVNANGSFSATLAVALADRLQITITDQAGNQTVVAVPRFTRTNADGSVAAIVGREGGRVFGPAGIAVDVPVDSLPDGTVMTIRSIPEAAFPTQLTAEQKQFFSFSGGLELDFGGATPAKYLNVSLPPTGDELFTDRWIIGQVVDDGGQQVFNIVDTARLIDDRITTSSPPCPGVQAAGKFAALKPKAPVGVMFGRFSSGGLESMTMNFKQPMFGYGSSVSLPYSLIATPSATDVCIPLLAGKVTVQPNSQKVVIPAQTFTPLDRQIIVRNQRLNREFFYPHNVADYRFLVEGTGKDKFKVTVVGAAEQPAVFSILAASTPGFVNISLDITTLNSFVSAVKIENLTRHTSPRFFNQSDSAVELPVTGGKDDGYEVTIVDANGVRRILPATTPRSPTGTGNLIARAQGATVEADTVVTLVQLDTHDPANIVITHERAITDEFIRDGGFDFPFSGDESETFLLKVAYPRETSRPPDSIPIPAVVITISNPVTGRVISTLNALVPPPDMPFNLGKVAGDRRPPGIKSTPDPLIGFDPTRSLSFTFSEGVTRDSVEADGAVTLTDDNGARVNGTLRLSNQNKTVTFVPDAPLRLNAGYTLSFNNIRDASDNVMARADFRITTVGPSITSPNAILNMLDQLTIVKKPGADGTTQTLGFGMTGDLGKTHAAVILDLTAPNNPVVLATIPAADGGRVTVLRGLVDLETGRSPAAYPKQDDVIECGGSAGKKRFTGDLLIVSTYTVGAGSAIRFYDITNPNNASCLVGSKLLTVNPGNLGGVRNDGAIRSEFNVSRTVVTLKDGARWKAYAAIENVGLLMVDVGLSIPSTSNTNLAPEPYAPGSYVDVVAANGRLIAIERGGNTLDILDASLARLSSIEMPLRSVRGLAYTEALPIDLNQDSQIGQNEVRDLAFVGGVDGVTIVDVTNPGSIAVVGQIPIKAEIFSLDFDAEKRKLFAGGRLLAEDGTATGDYTVFIIDLSGPNPFPPVTSEGHTQDDRIVWQSAAATYAAGDMAHRAVRFDPETRTLYIGNARGYDTLRLDPNLTGQASYTYFKATEHGIDYAHGIELPIRGAVVELHRPGTADLFAVQWTTTDENGFYTFFGAPIGEPLEVRVRAILGSAEKPTATVVDNTTGREIYKKSSEIFTLGPTGKQTHNILAKTVWNAASRRYGVRDGAPFAILDDVYQAQTQLRSVDPKIDLTASPIALAWSVKNSPSKKVDKPKGLLGNGAHYSGSENTLYLSGKENNDTDEYDTQVILHEWSHYFMDKYSRDDTVAGEHGYRYVLDPRVSFSEGFATAFAAMMTNDPNYVDTGGRAQSQGFLQAIEDDEDPATSFYAESAVQELLWDLYDDTGTDHDIEIGHSGGFFDGVALGLKPIYDAMRNGVKNTPGFTTIFPLLADVLAPLKADPSRKTDVDNIVALAKGENIFPDNADQFEQFTEMSIVRSPKLTIKIGRLYTPVSSGIGSTAATAFGPGTPFAGQPLETNTRYDKKPNDDANRFDESVYFKFDVAKGDPPNADVRRPYNVTVTGVSGIFSLTINENGRPLLKSVDSSSPTETACLAPGPHAAVVRGYDLVGGKKVAATRRFTIRVGPQVVINGKIAGSCTPPAVVTP